MINLPIFTTIGDRSALEFLFIIIIPLLSIIISLCAIMVAINSWLVTTIHRDHFLWVLHRANYGISAAAGGLEGRRHSSVWSILTPESQRRFGSFGSLPSVVALPRSFLVCEHPNYLSYGSCLVGDCSLCSCNCQRTGTVGFDLSTPSSATVEFRFIIHDPLMSMIPFDASGTNWTGWHFPWTCPIDQMIEFNYNYISIIKSLVKDCQ